MIQSILFQTSENLLHRVMPNIRPRIIVLGTLEMDSLILAISGFVIWART